MATRFQYVMTRGLTTVVSTVVSFVCLAAIVVILPMFHTRIQRSNTLMRAQLHKCHAKHLQQDSNEIWGQLAKQGARAKRQYSGATPSLAGKCCSCQQGPPGPPGPSGKDGQSGSPGMLGTNGRNGHPGQYVIAEKSSELPCQKCPSSPQGPPGYPGKKGPRGPAGSPGTQGIPAEPGRAGPPGPTGIRGAPGEFGMQGPPGDMGKVLNGAPQGPSGKTGAIGARGKPGTAGRDGHPGVEGFEGVRGSQGERGGKGQQGLPGPVGPPGSPGNKGSCSHCANGPKKGGASRTSAPSEQPIRTEVENTREHEEETGYGVSHNAESSSHQQTPSSSYGVSESAQTEVKPAAEPSQESYKAKAAPTSSANHALKTVGLHDNYQHSVRAKVHSYETHVPSEGYEPAVPFVPKEVRPAGYTMEQLAPFATPSNEDENDGDDGNEEPYQPTMVRTRQGFNVQLVGGYAANPVGRSWNHDSAHNSAPPMAAPHQSRQLSPPGAGSNY